MNALPNRIALVTGASRGIGWHTALALAATGAHVIATARTVGGLEELDDEIRKRGGSATLVPMDLTDYGAIDRLGAEIDKRFGRLDVLVANAGMLGGLSPLGHYEPKTFERVMAVNVTANWRLIRSLDPLLRASEAGRAIFISSGAAHSCGPYWGAYSASKAALEALARTYAAECAKTRIEVVIVNPGVARTAMRAQAMPGEDPATIADPSVPAAAIARLADPATALGGVIFDVTSAKFLNPRKPA
jgi:NAD(P)-dependent dehydrogenase (short-subunit alcohol dehydrogenase family)